MLPTVIREWLAEFKVLAEDEFDSYAATLGQNFELVTALYELYENDISQEVTDPVCHQLFKLYLTARPELKRFTLELVPVLVSKYLTAISHNQKKKCAGIEAFLLGLYNLEIVEADGKPKIKTFTIPTLAAPSIYHEPPSLATLALTESALMRYHSDTPIVITIGPLPPVDRINAQNRLSVLSFVMNLYNTDIANYTQRSHSTLCLMCSKLCKNGFENLGQSESECNLNESFSSQTSKRSVGFRHEPRIAVNSGLLVELLNGVYFALFNGQARDATLALEDIHLRASYELYPDVLLVTNAIRNSLDYNPSGQPQDGPMGISIALSPTQSHPAFSKDAITNASFRAKKLPDDIETDSEHEINSDEISPKDYKCVPSLKHLVSFDKLHGSANSISTRKDRTPKSSGHRIPSVKFHDIGASPILVEVRNKLLRRKRIKSGGEDIEVQEDDPALQPPPHYDEVTEADKSAKSSGGAQAMAAAAKLQLSKPLKSIMKSVHRKEGDSKKKSEKDHVDTQYTNSPKSPTKHSASASSSLSNSFNGEVDLGMVNVQVIRSGSKSKVDSVEMTNIQNNHKRSSSNYSDEFVQSNHVDNKSRVSTSNSKDGLPGLHSKDGLPALNGGAPVDEEDDEPNSNSYNTSL